MHCLRARRPEVMQGLVFKLVNTHFVNYGGNGTLEAACMLAFGPGFAPAEGPTYGENNVEELLAQLHVN
ncbi:hypothetical protein FOA52_005522 [Chlamydomonas sp. UWO 241]|nr:hypothetical protein FOA52_005522 [Chlamydomonas sp. UWO 241]